MYIIFIQVVSRQKEATTISTKQLNSDRKNSLYQILSHFEQNHHSFDSIIRKRLHLLFRKIKAKLNILEKTMRQQASPKYAIDCKFSILFLYYVF